MTADQTPLDDEGQGIRPFPLVNPQAVNIRCPILTIQAQLEAQAGTVHRTPEEGHPCPGGFGA
jgi:hypothetical protein